MQTYYLPTVPANFVVSVEDDPVVVGNKVVTQTDFEPEFPNGQNATQSLSPADFATYLSSNNLTLTNQNSYRAAYSVLQSGSRYLSTFAQFISSGARVSFNI